MTGLGSAVRPSLGARLNQSSKTFLVNLTDLDLARFHVCDALLKSRGVGVVGFALRDGRVPNLEGVFFPAGRPKDVRFG